MDLIIVRPEQAPDVQQQLGGHWSPTGAVLPPASSPAFLKMFVAELREEDYPLIVYRRR